MADKPISEHVWRLVFIVVSILILLLQCTMLILQHKQTADIRQIHQQLDMQPSMTELLSMTSASPLTEHQFQTAEPDEGNHPPKQPSLRLRRIRIVTIHPSNSAN